MLSQDFKEFIALLNEHNVRYLVVGGYAVAFHGHPRYTKDIDLWVGNDPANAASMIRVLNAFGFSSLGLSEADFTGSEQVIQLGYPPNRIDLITGITGMDFETAYASRTTVDVDGISISFIGLHDLKATKRIAGRHQDLADLENLE